MGEVQNRRILANRPIFDRIFHTNRKGRQYGVSRECLTSQKEKKSPIWAYFSLRIVLHVSSLFDEYFLRGWINSISDILMID